MLAAMKKLGQPSQYLSAKLSTVNEVNDFAKWLWEYFPEHDDTCYQHNYNIPPVAEADLATTPPICLHVSALGFSKDCSLKPPPGSDLFMALIEQYLCDGFLSSGDPLFVVQSVNVTWEGLSTLWAPDKGQPVLQPFSVGYMKGMARMTTLFALLHYCWAQGIDIKTAHPKLYDSVLRIWVHHAEQASKVDEAIQTMKLSARGSIRKAVNVIQLAIMIQNLFAFGLTDFGLFIRKWNQSSARNFQILGKRALSLKLLFEYTPKDFR
jgi:hypothetical protein